MKYCQEGYGRFAAIPNLTDAARIFDDPERIERYDVEHSEDEDRRQTIGFYKDMLFVVFTERDNVTRIISARVAEPYEWRIYYGDSEVYGWYRVQP